MPDDFSQAVANSTPAAGGIIGIIVAIFTAVKYFATQRDLDLLKSEASKNDEIAVAKVLAEVAEKYINKSEMNRVYATLDYMRGKIDQVADKVLNKP